MKTPWLSQRGQARCSVRPPAFCCLDETLISALPGRPDYEPIIFGKYLQRVEPSPAVCISRILLWDQPTVLAPDTIMVLPL